MCKLINELARDKGINVDDANYIYTFISGYLVNKIPALSQVIEDIFEDSDAGKLKEHIITAIETIQQQHWQEKFKNYTMPPQMLSLTDMQG